MLSRDIITYLTDLGVVSGYEVDCFINYFPEEPANIVAIFERPGLGTRKQVDCITRKFEIYVRNTDPVNGNAKIFEIFNALDKDDETSVDLTADRWAVITAQNTPSLDGVDAFERHIFHYEINAVVDKTF